MDHKLIAKNTFYQTFSRVISSGLGFVVTIIIARHFGVIFYGDFTKITSFVALFYLVADFGLNAIYLQKDEKINFKDLFYLRIFTAFLLIIIANVIPLFLPGGHTFGFSPEVRFGIMIFSFSILAQSIVFSSSALFQKEQRFDLLTKANFAGSLLTLFSVILSVYYSLPFYFIFISFLLGGLITGLLSFIFIKKEFMYSSFNFHFVKKLIVKSLPLGLMLIFNLIYFRIDILLLSVLRPTQDVGIYGLSYKFFDFLIALPLFLSNSIYPHMLETSKNSRNFTKMFKTYFFAFLFISLAITILFWFLSPLMSLIKNDFIYSVLSFRILLLSLPLFFLTSFLQWILISQKKQKYLLIVYLLSAVFNIVLNLLFIPSFSYVASGIITGVSEFIVFVFLLWKVMNLKES